MAVSEEELKVKITADTDDYKRKLEEAQRKLDEFGRKGKTSVDPVTQSVETLKKGLATLGVGAFLKDSWQAYSTQIEAETKLTTIMKQRLGATDAEVESIKRLASEQQKLGVVGDEVQLAGAQQLATFATQKSTIESLLPAMNNLLAQQNGYQANTSSAVSVANMLGKALQGQTSALSRVGISFTEAQEQALKFGTEEEKAATLAQVIQDNVGEMNAALRNTPNGQVVALANDFGDLKEQIGEAFQPLVQTAIPLLSQAVADAVPLVQAFGSGLEVISGAINSLSPEMRQLILYVGLGAAAFKTLSFAVGGSTAGLLLAGMAIVGIIGKFRQAEKEASGAADGAFNGATVSANNASKAVDDLNGSITEAAASIGGLASFDEITKLSGSGNGSIASKIATPDDVDTINSASLAASDLQDMLNGLGVPEFDWDGIKSGLSETWNDITRLFPGNETEVYNGLLGLNEKIKTIFGEEWTTFWQGVGKNMWDAVNGADREKDFAILELDNKARAIFGEDWTNFWMGVGSAAEQAVQEHIVKPFSSAFDGIQKLFSGDFNGAMVSFANAAASSAFVPEDVGNQLVMQTQEWANRGSDVYTDAVGGRKGGGGMNRNDYSDNDIRDPAMEYLDAMNAMSGASNWATGGIPSAPVTNVYIDGERVYDGYTARQSDATIVSNGRG